MDIRKKILVSLLLVYSSLVLCAQAVNINTADKAALMSINGIGESRAEAIIVWREKNGPFKSVDQLKEVQGIGQAILDSNRENLTVKDGE